MVPSFLSQVNIEEMELTISFLKQPQQQQNNNPNKQIKNNCRGGLFLFRKFLITTTKTQRRGYFNNFTPLFLD